MSTGNPIYGVGGTAQDGGVSTAATVADGGPSGQKEDPTYQPPAEVAEAGSDMNAKPGESTRSKTEAKTSNPIYGVGGTAQDGGISTAATVADGGPNASKPDPTYKPS